MSDYVYGWNPTGQEINGHTVLQKVQYENTDEGLEASFELSEFKCADCDHEVNARYEFLEKRPECFG